MKIDYVVMGSNMNPLYLDFWKPISRVWKEVFNITPVLGLICDEDSDFIQDDYGLVKKFRSIDGVSDVLQSQIIRLYLCKEIVGNIIISDIDMLPLSKEYFIEQVKKFDENNLYVMTSDNIECIQNKEIPMCYNIGSNRILCDVLDISDISWYTFTQRLNDMNYDWTTDQRYLWDRIYIYTKTNMNVVFKQRGWTPYADKRIDRLDWQYDCNLIKKDYYIDAHMLRPYREYKSEIDKIINLIYK